MYENAVKAADKILKDLKKFFNYDENKVRRWFATPNPLLGNMMPLQMLNSGKIQKLLYFIDAMLDENERSH